MRKYSIFLAVALTACGSDKKTSHDTVSQDPNTGTVTNNPNTTGGTTAGNTNQSINPSDPTKTYTGPEVVPMGRMLAVNGNWQFNWAGSSFTCRPQATSVTINLISQPVTATSQAWMDVFLDGALQPNAAFQITSGTTAYAFALPNAEPHVVTWSLRTEANYGAGPIIYTGITPSGGTLLPTETPNVSPRQIEFIGDSITNGYGALSGMRNPPLGSANACSTSGDYNQAYTQDSSLESATLSYATLTAQHFSAQYALIASSGRGVYRNGASGNDTAGTTTPTMSTIYPYALHPYLNTENGNAVVGGNMWSPNGWAPQAVVINLGTNDYGQHGYVLDANGNRTKDANGNYLNANPINTSAYSAAYAALIAEVHNLYPNALIFPMVGPMLTSLNNTNCQAAITTAITTAQGAPYNVPAGAIAPIVNGGVQRTDTPADTGCEYHPLPSEHADVAAALDAAIGQSTLGWK